MPVNIQKQKTAKEVSYGKKNHICTIWLRQNGEVSDPLRH